MNSRNWRQSLFAGNFYTTVCHKKQAALIFTETLLFLYKTAYFFNDRHDSYKKADGNSNSYVTNLILFSQLTLNIKANIAEDEIKVSVILADKYKVKAKNFVFPIFNFLSSFYGN